MAERKPHREFCAICGRVSRVSFFVPHETWALCVHRSRLHDIHCLSCFTEQADERGVQWDREIQFYPVSWVTQNEIVSAALSERDAPS